MNKNNYKNILLALLLMLIALPAAMMAQTSSERYVIVTEKDGTVTVFNFDEVESVTWEMPEPLPGSVGTGKATINGNNVDVEWIQLWADGPMFAKYNVGVTNGKAESYGGYYCWGSSIDKDPNYSYNEGESALTGNDDTATNLWGSNWRMPTEAEFVALCNNCTVEWTTVNGVKGRKFTGKGDYATNSVFLPAAGYCEEGVVTGQGDVGFYWSSTPDEGDARCMYSDFQVFGTGNDHRYFGHSVRAIYDPQPEPTTGTAKATINDSEVDVNWVQLWENGPKFAKYNVGVTDGKAESYGGYYAWGGNQHMVDDHVNGEAELSGDTDTATKLWGSNWRMPTKAELDDLLANCDVEWTTVNDVEGRIFTGKGDYASNSVFLPAAGHWYNDRVVGQGYDDYKGYYWSSTPSDSNPAYFLYLSSGDQRLLGLSRVHCCSVRAIYDPQPEPTTGTAKATIGGDEVDVTWVQLWENGPKFAEYNVEGTFTFTQATANPFVWGANWCTPSQDDMQELLLAAQGNSSSKVTCNCCEFTQGDGKWGFKFTGLTDGYTGNSVFFPAQSGNSGFGSAEYWSATADGSLAWFMFLNYYYGDWNSSWSSHFPDHTCLVRPVLAE